MLGHSTVNMTADVTRISHKNQTAKQRVSSRVQSTPNLFHVWNKNSTVASDDEGQLQKQACN